MLRSLRPGFGRGRLGPLLAAGAIGVLVGFPLAELLWASVAGPPGTSASAAWGSLGQTTVTTAITHTVVVSALAAAAAVALGAGFAVAAERSDLPARRVLGALALAPLVVPPYVGGLSWIEAYAGAGVTEKWVGLSFGWVSGPAGVTMLLTIEGYPLVYLLVRAVLASQHAVELEEAARCAGARPWRVLAEVVFPLLRPALFAGALLVFVASASDFGVLAILGIPAGFSTITTAIYADLSFAGGVNAIGSATALSTLLGVLTIAVLVLIGRFLAAADLGSGGTSSLGSARFDGPRTAPLCRFGRARHVAAGVWWLFALLSTFLPFVALFLEAVGNGFQLSAWPGHWTTASFAAALSGANLAALGRSALLAGLAGVTVALGGALVAWVLRRGGRRLRAVAALAALPFALPGSVMAIAVLLAWQRWLYGTLLIIVLAYVARFLVIGVRAADAGLANLGDELVEAGRAAGAGSGRVLRDIVLPSISPSLWASFGLVFLLAIHELTMSSLLYGPSTATFAVTVLDAEQAGNLALTAALAVVVTAITAAAALLVALARRRAASAAFAVSVPAAPAPRGNEVAVAAGR